MTDPSRASWSRTDARGRPFEASVLVGTGDDVWARASADVLRWRVKTRSGFDVRPDTRVEVGARPVIVARVWGVGVREPVEVVTVVEQGDRVGFAYRTLPGHPVSGEEAFVVHREHDRVILTIRSLTRPASTPGWRMLFPVLLLAQRIARRRYLRAL